MAKGSPGPEWPDERLVEACLDGSEPAWRALVDKYKNLVWAIVLRYGIPHDDATDVFQTVWLDIYNDLEQLRNRRSVKPWLSSLVRNKCFYWTKSSRRRHQFEDPTLEAHDLADEHREDPEILAEMERQQLVRLAIAELPDRCREMIHMLFFRQPPMPYKEVAETLGLAVGSIGFIRGRCLKKLEKALANLGHDGEQQP